jgi:hypothetical protein
MEVITLNARRMFRESMKLAQDRIGKRGYPAFEFDAYLCPRRHFIYKALGNATHPIAIHIDLSMPSHGTKNKSAVT